MTPARDDDLTRRYREVSGRLDEAPSAQARAAILAAAARQVQARPGDALKPAQRPVRSFSRWPLGAAAAVLLSTLAVLLADRTERESRTELATNEIAPARGDAAPSTTPEAAKPALPASVGEAADKITTEAKAQREVAPPPPVGLEQRERRAQESAARRADVPPQPAAPASTGARQMPAPVAPRAEAVAPSDPAPAQRSATAPPAAADSGSGERAADARLQKRERDEAKVQESMSNAAPAAAPALGALSRSSAKAESGASVWLERIIELRRKGDDAAADVELKKFRERYPEVVVPPQALPSVGTR